MKILVIGGTGTVGSQVAGRLIEKGLSVRTLTRSVEKARSFPQGLEAAIGSLEEPGTLPAAFSDVDRVFLLNALTENETGQGLAALEAAKKAGVRRIVYLSVHMPDAEARKIPHFATKIPVEEALRVSGAEWTILRPNSFFQNDLWYRQPMTEFSVYPQPIGSVGLARVDVRDIAEAAVNALTAPGHAGQEYALHGPVAMTGESTAATWGRHLGREIRYGGDDLEAWASEASRGLPGWMVEELRVMYDYFQRKGFLPGPEDAVRQARVVGHPPRSFDDYAKETAAAWKR